MLFILYVTFNTVILILFFYVLLRAFHFYHHRYVLSKIPAPPGFFFLGHLPYVFVRNGLFDFLRETAQNYRPIYRFQTFFVTTVNFMAPEDLEILLSSMKHLQKSRIYSFLNRWLGEGLLTSKGKKWHLRRKILTPAFHVNMLQKFLNVFYDETNKFVEEIQKQILISPEIDVLPHVTKMTLQSIGETAMGLDGISENEQKSYKEAIYKIGSILFNRLAVPWLQIPQIYNLSRLGKEEARIVDILHNFAYKIIKEREQVMTKNEQTKEVLNAAGRKCLPLLDLLLTAKRNGENIDYDGIREEVDTFMFEGHDTSTSAISLLLYILAVHPDIQERVYEEIREILPNSLTAPTYTDLMDLKYMERVIKETLRLYPSVPFISRYCSEEFTTNSGYKIPKGTICHIHIFDLHRDPNIYPEPMNFDPDRFLPENCRTRHPFAYLPFSAGPRNCIGQKFAMLEIKSVLCGVLKEFQLESVGNINTDLKFSPDLVLRTQDKIRVRFHKRL